MTLRRETGDVLLRHFYYLSLMRTHCRLTNLAPVFNLPSLLFPALRNAEDSDSLGGGDKLLRTTERIGSRLRK
jgi:hypothetical protein